MCGILGVVFRDPTAAADIDRLAVARDTLAHRGPDDAGIWHRPGAAFAHRRLKVLDLNAGRQPVADNRFAMVYNGEIYNFRDLQSHYVAQGAVFHTQCDTEVLFHALSRDGEQAIDRCNGMFAFGHYDHRDRRLLLARDRLGQKPLYWHVDEHQLVFASELKAILTFLDRRFELDAAAMDQFFARGYILSPRTIFKSIHKLPAGCLLKLDAARWQWDVQPYWDFQQVAVPNDDTKAINHLDELLSDAVRMRLVSDVPLGCLLSGGIDSTLITAMACRAKGSPVEAFTIGFEGDDDLNELPHARRVAEHHGCRWRHDHGDVGDFLAMSEDLSRYHDEPFANIAMFPMRRLAELARLDLTVVLSGQGGDELAAGYPGRYGWALNPDDSHDLQAYDRCSTFMPWSPGRDIVFSREVKAALADRMAPGVDIRPYWQRFPGLSRLGNALYADVKTNLPDYLVCVEERMTMAVGLEARNPMLDFRVVNYLLSLPDHMKVREGQYKWILLQLAKRYGPAEAVDRPKRGFTPPFRRWILTSGPAIAEVCRRADDYTKALYSPQWRAFLLNGRYNDSAVLPVLFSLTFAQWFRRYSRFIHSDIAMPLAA